VLKSQIKLSEEIFLGWLRAESFDI